MDVASDTQIGTDVLLDHPENDESMVFGSGGTIHYFSYSYVRTLNFHPEPLVNGIDEETQPPEIVDPWYGPKMFTEDLYTGGDNIDTSTVTPNHLSEMDAEGSDEEPETSSPVSRKPLPKVRDFGEL
jgi:hypothetical protein